MNDMLFNTAYLIGMALYVAIALPYVLWMYIGATDRRHPGVSSSASDDAMFGLVGATMCLVILGTSVIWPLTAMPMIIFVVLSRRAAKRRK